MKLATFSMLFGSCFLIILRYAGIEALDAIIIASLIFLNTAFQVFARGNVSCIKKPDYKKISNKMPVLAYSTISSAGLLTIVFVIAKATYLI